MEEGREQGREGERVGGGREVGHGLEVEGLS